MLVVNTNSTAMYANMHLGRANEHVKQSMQKLASGLRINSAKDDAAGLNIATQLNALERGLSVSIRNGQDALSIAQVADLPGYRKQIGYSALPQNVNVMVVMGLGLGYHIEQLE